ncbi:MAG: glycoside hydrolase family 20 zincin-like fold domain-containing protein [Candidatus Eisenbacteria bacterium]
MTRPAPCLVLVALVTARLAAAETTPRATVIPSPRTCRPELGSVTLDGTWSIRLAAPSAADSFAAQTLSSELWVTRRWSLRIVGDARDHQVVLLPETRRPDRPTLYDTQGYTLAIAPGRITITAPSTTGRYYGIQTLRQIARAAPAGRIHCQRVLDYPDLEWRGVSDDISRGQMPTRAEFERTLRLLGEYKMNMYALYIEDAFRFPSAPRVGVGRARLTPATLAELSALAGAHHIELVPILETLGHQTRMLSLPEYRGLAEVQDPLLGPWSARTTAGKLGYWLHGILWGAPDDPSPEPWSFAPALPESRRFVEDLLSDLTDAGSGHFVHLGGDEAIDVGQGVSATAAARHGVGPLLADYFTELASHVKSHGGRRAIVYADGLLDHPEAIPRVAAVATMMYWNYDPEPDVRELTALRDAGATHLMVSPGVWNWHSFAPNLGRAFANTAAMTRAARGVHAEGCVLASWGDDGAESLRALDWPAVAYTAECSWSGAAPEARSFLDRYVAVHFGCASDALASAIMRTGWQEFGSVGWYGRLYHRTPAVRRRGVAWLARMRVLRADMDTTRWALARDGARVTRNREDLDAIRHAARRFAYVAHREQLLDALARVAPARDTAETRPATGKIAALLAEATAIRTDYERLWRATAEPAGLAFDLDRLRVQESGLGMILRSCTASADVGTRAETHADPAHTPGSPATPPVTTLQDAPRRD